MSNENVANMVDSLTGGDNVAAQDAFKSALTDKIGQALDDKRQTMNDGSAPGLKITEVDTEGDGGNRNIDFVSNGFKMRETDVDSNASGGNYIYLAVAATPFKYSTAQ